MLIRGNCLVSTFHTRFPEPLQGAQMVKLKIKLIAPADSQTDNVLASTETQGSEAIALVRKSRRRDSSQSCESLHYDPPRRACDLLCLYSLKSMLVQLHECK